MADEQGQWAADACGRRAGVSGLRIVEIEYDAPGNDGENLNGEWVVVGSDDELVDLSGWALKDETSSHRFVFPNGFSLAAGSTVRIFSGCGSPTESELYWCQSGSAIWNNSGDTAFLLDPAGNTVATLAY
ncbi:MAG: lamin tail domain-containing protein [Acidimicrobiales bacterium]